MPTHDPPWERLRQAMAALGEPHRFWLARCLAQRSRSVGELVTLSGWPQPLVSHHLACLSRAGLVDCRQDGRRRLYRLDAPDDHQLQRLLDLVGMNAVTGTAGEPPPPGAVAFPPLTDAAGSAAATDDVPGEVDEGSSAPADLPDEDASSDSGEIEDYLL